MLKSQINRLFRAFSPFNRRKYKRYSVENLVECEGILSKDGVDVRLPLELQNISFEGALIVTGEYKLLPSKVILVIFKLPSRSDAVVLRGVVKRTYRKTYERRYYSAIQFSGNKKENLYSVVGFVSGGKFAGEK